MDVLWYLAACQTTPVVSIVQLVQCRKHDSSPRNPCVQIVGARRVQ